MVIFYSIEFDRGGHLIGYPGGTPPLSMKINGCRHFDIYRHVLVDNVMDSVSLRRYFILFQRSWRAWRKFRRRCHGWLRRRELGPALKYRRLF
jgi:hypothetical protein